MDPEGKGKKENSKELAQYNTDKEQQKQQLCKVKTKKFPKEINTLKRGGVSKKAFTYSSFTHFSKMELELVDGLVKEPSLKNPNILQF